MTLTHIINTLYSISIGGFFNRTQFTREQFGKNVRHAFDTDMVRTTPFGKCFYIEAALGDGWWLCRITKLANGEFDLYIPDTREQEARLYTQLTEAA